MRQNDLTIYRLPAKPGTERYAGEKTSFDDGNQLEKNSGKQSKSKKVGGRPRGRASG